VPDPAELHYLGVTGQELLWLLTLISFAVFGGRVARHIKVLSRARGEKRWDHIGKRMGLVVKNVLGQQRLFDEPVIGAAHFVIFWAFIFYATTFFWSLLRGLAPGLPIPYPDEVLWVTSAVQVMGVLGIVALCVAAARRYLFTPVSLELSRDAAIILILIGIVLVSSLAGARFRDLASGGGQSSSTVGGFLAAAFASIGVSPGNAPTFYVRCWWIHIITVLGFLAYLPYSKHLHLLASPFSVFFASLEPGKMPLPSEGASRFEEFTWREILSGFACAECGRCDRVCPSFTSGYPLSPKQLIHHVKELALAAEGHMEDMRPMPDESPGNARTFLGDVVHANEIWACTTCGSCMERCPVFNEHIPLVVEMRRKLVSEGDVQPRVQEAFTSLARYGNSFGLSPRQRAKWTQGLELKLKDARKEPVEYLWFVGDYAAYDPRVQPVTRSLARVLQQSNLDFGILYENEQNSGNDVRRVGEEGLFETLAQKNRESMGKAHFESIVTTDPHSYHALKHEYGLKNGNGGVHVVHHTELLDELIRTGKLQLRKQVNLTATYHDPCYLGRYNGVYDSPRRVLRALGVNLVEMPRNRSQAYCCGAGGGRIWMDDVAGIKERPAESRLREAAKLRGVDTIFVSCPKDLVMFQDALKTTGLEGKLSVKDIAEVIQEVVAA